MGNPYSVWIENSVKKDISWFLQSFVSLAAFRGLFSLRVYLTSSGDGDGHELFPKRKIRDI